MREVACSEKASDFVAQLKCHISPRSGRSSSNAFPLLQAFCAECQPPHAHASADHTASTNHCPCICPAGTPFYSKIIGMAAACSLLPQAFLRTSEIAAGTLFCDEMAACLLSFRMDSAPAPCPAGTMCCDEVTVSPVQRRLSAAPHTRHCSCICPAATLCCNDITACLVEQHQG